VLDGAREDLVVYFGNSPWYGPAGTDRHVTEELTRYAPVLYVEPPLSFLTARRNPAFARAIASRQPLEILEPRIARLVTTVAPGMTRPGLHHLTAPLVRRATRAAVDTLYGPGAPVAAIVSCRVKPLWRTVSARRRVFFATDDLPAGADLLGEPRERLLRDEARTMRDADAVAAVSPALCERYAESGYPATLVPNGCRPQAYEAVDTADVPADVDLPGPVAGFVGHVNHRIDLGLLEAVANTGVSLLVVGPVVPGFEPERFAALAARPNVAWVGGKPYAELPGYLRMIDVGLTPYADTAFNRASFPLKTLEYLAAGRGVVATPLPANDWLGTDLIAVASGASDYAARVAGELERPRTETLAARRRAFAASHSWAQRARTLAGLMGLTEPTSAAPTSGLVARDG
jgi:teichuronic acid biosynthesis glycosyltransferase TuaH